jgi:hypothetical protein
VWCLPYFFLFVNKCLPVLVRDFTWFVCIIIILNIYSDRDTSDQLLKNLRHDFFFRFSKELPKISTVSRGSSGEAVLRSVFLKRAAKIRFHCIIRSELHLFLHFTIGTLIFEKNIFCWSAIGRCFYFNKPICPRVLSCLILKTKYR